LATDEKSAAEGRMTHCGDQAHLFENGIRHDAGRLALIEIYCNRTL